MGKKQLPRRLGLLRKSGNPAPILARQSSKGEHPESHTKTETEARKHYFAYPFAMLTAKTPLPLTASKCAVVWHGCETFAATPKN